MKIFTTFFPPSVAIVLTLAMASVAFAAPGGETGKPENPGGGGGQGKPDDPGGGGGKPDKPGRGKGDIFADQVIRWRDLDGLPYHVQVPAGIDDETGEAADARVSCLQPIFIPADPLGSDDPGVNTHVARVTTNAPVPILENPLTNPADGREASPVPLGGSGYAGEECDVDTNYSTCDPDEDGVLDNICAEEVDFGRLSVARSPQRTIDKQLREVILNIQDATLSLDHAGRLVYDGITVDSPVQNLAVHQALLIDETLISQTRDAIELPDPYKDPEGTVDEPIYGFLDHAASALGAAAEKGGWIDVDLVTYDNRVLSIPSQTSWDTIKGDGNVGVNDEDYYDFSSYQYDRNTKYPGCMVGYFLIDGILTPFQGTISEFVFENEPFTGENVHGFATAADDSLRVITFVHDNVVTYVDTVGDDTLCSELSD